MPSLKIGRNDQCICGSGKKYKKCCKDKHLPRTVRVIHSGATPEVIEKGAARMEAKQRAQTEWTARYGHVRPTIHTKNWGKKLVAVGNQIVAADDNCKFIPDFLLDYVPYVFGKDWFDQQMRKPENERHPVSQWRAACLQQKYAGPRGRPIQIVPSGWTLLYMTFAFGLYAIADNSRLDELLVHRLKHPEHFQSALHEVFAEATCLRAGFAIERENESKRGSRHAEFTAIHKETGERFSVEAKSKGRPGEMGKPGVRREQLRLRFGHLINGAIAKKPPHPLVIFIDTNLPFRAAQQVYGDDPSAGPSEHIKKLREQIRKQHNGQEAYAMLVMTNMSSRYELPQERPLLNHLSALMTQNLQSNRGRALRALYNAVLLYENIPNEFPDF